MKIITFRIESDHDAELLKKILSETKFENPIQGVEEDEITDEELKMFEERVERYEKDPSTGISPED